MVGRRHLQGHRWQSDHQKRQVGREGVDKVFGSNEEGIISVVADIKGGTALLKKFLLAYFDAVVEVGVCLSQPGYLLNSRIVKALQYCRMRLNKAL